MIFFMIALAIVHLFIAVMGSVNHEIVIVV